MARRKKARAATPKRDPAPRPAAPPIAASPGRSRTLVAVLAGVALLLAAATLYFGSRPRPAPPSAASTAAAPVRATLPAPQYVGSSACASCHKEAYASWRGSQHAVAMLEASAASVRGDFANAKVSYGGVTSTFFQRDGRYFVRTDGPDGKPAEFEIKYTFGVEPLQQYLIELPGGRLQALGVAWDSRPKSAGGQRWFHLYPDRKLKAGDPLHWTGIDQNWNYQCADCHSTNLRKNYDAARAEFRTTWSEINVGCESCHGPASNHVAWAKEEGDRARYGDDKGLAAKLDERRGVTWTKDAARATAERSRPRTTDREIEVCARCHARRGQFSDDHHAGQPFHDAFRPALLDRGLYWPDGQQRDEVYIYGSFLQSLMHAKGVTCSDCHDPHTQKLRAAGNAVCAQCHLPTRYDVAEHHHHKPGTDGAQCVACHMPTTTYMVVDPRRDHSMRIPRPDRSVSMGVPNACNQCHGEKSAQWAADAVKRWYPQPRPGYQAFAEAFHAAERGSPGASAALLAVIEDRAQPPIVRASAISRLAPDAGPAALPAIARALDDPDANVRMAAVQALGSTDAATRLRYLPRMLRDPVRAVRIDAARALAGEPEQRLAAADRPAFDAALAEYVAAQRFNADRPEAQTALGVLHASRGEVEDATAAFRTALRLDPTYVQAAVNLADLYRSRGLETEAESVLRTALKTNPRSGPALHALGLTLIRQKRLPEAVAALGEAAKVAPDDPRFAYVYAVALHDTGQPAEAIKVLEGALRLHPYDRDVLSALAVYEREAGRMDAARVRVERLREIEPDNPAWRPPPAAPLAGPR